MTRHGQFLLQPTEFRADPNVPMWVHFPRLHLLLGWGPGIWETIGTRVAGLRHVFLPRDGEPERPPVASVMDWRDNFHQFSKLRDLAPPLVIEGVGAECVRFAFAKDGWVRPEPHRCPSKRPHVIVPDGEYRVRHAFEGSTVFTLELRCRRLKPELRAKRESLGLDGPVEGRAGKQAERAFAEHIRRLTGPVVERRARELCKDETMRPSDFAELRAAAIRRRMGEIERRGRDAKGRSKRPYAEEDLLRLVCDAIARQEARDLVFEYEARPVCELSPAGFRTIV
ncbi:MAG TPA: hypothetical protein VL426_04695 [Candidatus Binatia bacterium]|jgi:hypothetical protein|nr:hypothetical protein [Candidatus Binatia bacterium]